MIEVKNRMAEQQKTLFGGTKKSKKTQYQIKMEEREKELEEIKKGIEEIKTYTLKKEDVDLNKFKSFINQAKWQDTTNCYIPHAYTLRKWNNKTDFEYFIRVLRLLGYQEPFFWRTIIYFEFEGYRYWTMGWVVGLTTVINRMKWGDKNGQ